MTDVYVSMNDGKEDIYKEKYPKTTLLTQKLMSQTDQKCIFILHCLPCKDWFRSIKRCNWKEINQLFGNKQKIE